MIGMIVIHFSFGSFEVSHGLSTCPFFTRREWKYLPTPAEFTARDEFAAEADVDAYGVADPCGVSNGLRFSLYALGVPDRGANSMLLSDGREVW